MRAIRLSAPVIKTGQTMTGSAPAAPSRRPRRSLCRLNVCSRKRRNPASERGFDSEIESISASIDDSQDTTVGLEPPLCMIGHSRSPTLRA